MKTSRTYHGLWVGAIALVALFVLGACAPTKAASIQGQTLRVALNEFSITPAGLSVKPNTDVTLQITNKGGLEHNTAVVGSSATTGTLKPGQTASLHLGKVSGTIKLLCSIAGHADAGMRAQVTMLASAGDGSSGLPQQMTADQMDAMYLAGVKAFPAKTQGLGNQVLAPVMDGGVKVFDLTASEINWEAAPGDIRKAMAYNGQIPGPVIRVDLGDHVRIKLHNQLHESTAMHFHGLQVPNDMDGIPGITQPLIKPGETFTYDFTVRNSGTNMYHSHMNGATQIPGGLLGAFIVDSPKDPPAPHEELIVLNDGPLGYTINGKGFPATQPVVAKLGEKVRIRYMNQGLQAHPMHLHGLIQKVIAKDGMALTQPYVADTVLVGPGERYDVLVEASEVGIWAYHCHILTHAEGEQGMFGMVTAFIVR